MHMPLKKFLHIFTWPTLMIALNFRWPTPSTVLKNSDPPPYFSQPTPAFTLWPVPNFCLMLKQVFQLLDQNTSHFIEFRVSGTT
jgi:hypothetical protein